MCNVLRKSLVVGFSVLGLSLSAQSAQAASIPRPGLTNLNFLNYTGIAPKGQMSDVKPTGWTGGDRLTFVVTPGDASNPNSACGATYLSTYGCPSTLAIPGGYNYVEADGNPVFTAGFATLLTGLTVGQTYELSFYQAGSQQRDFANGQFTTEQWIVALGGLNSLPTVCYDCGAADAYYGGHRSTYSYAPGTSFVETPLMITPSGGLTDWQYVTVELTANAPTQILSFLAWGNYGNTINLPPVVFLAGINSPSGLDTMPEPATLVLLGTGLLALVARRRRRVSQ